ncbi:hypothetical protein SAMN06296386_109115 [Lachnospiraceae bacterium]|nr:hypothetical protein SAMN06296386_109115 [Lachnospiraceae bacterium]
MSISSTRDASPILMTQLKNKDTFKPFIDFVREHHELALCFRSDRAIIYRNRGKLWELAIEKGGPVVIINLAYAKFMSDWPDQIKAIFNMVRGGENFEEFRKCCIERNKNSFYIRPIRYNPFNDIGVIKDVYEILKYMQDDFYNKLTPVDYFKKSYYYDRGTTDEKANTSCQRNKEYEVQQELFLNNQFTDDGIFIYDMEFHQPKIKDTVINEKLCNLKKNEPDLLGIRFCNGKAVSLCLIEVKANERSLEGTSGVDAHMKGMEDYSQINELMMDRKIEACKIINQFKDLNLYNLDKEEYTVDDFIKIGIEIIFVFSDPITSNTYINHKINDCKVKIQLHKILKSYSECSDLCGGRFKIEVLKKTIIS